nr:MAG TPA: hypothetical protein [Caudoviricetes sp.]
MRLISQEVYFLVLVLFSECDFQGLINALVIVFTALLIFLFTSCRAFFH